MDNGHLFIPVIISKGIGGKILDRVNRDASLEKDRKIIRAIPYVVLISTALGVIIALLGPHNFGSALLRFCSAFVIGFAALGAYSFRYCDKGLLDRRLAAALWIVAPAVVSIVLIQFTSHVMDDITHFFSRFVPSGTSVNISIFVGVYLLTAVMMFVSHGVISTVVAYFRKYTARIYLSIEKIKNDGTDKGRDRVTRWVYCIPEIIDIERIELEPAPDDGRFPTRMFSSLALSIFILGLSVSSYVFLNPIFERALSLEEAVIVTVILTFFMPVLIIPWFITKDTGAKIKSQARDYYLWKGMRKRLFEGFFAFMMLLSLFAISMYLGYDLVRASFTYAGYVTIAAFLSLLYAFVYSNYYYKGFKEGIIENFNDAKRIT
jgi:hypothetical protein